MEKGIALYIHIPFCRQKCLYCDFPSFAKKENLMPEYVAALCKELETKADKKIKTIFIGGGTPTYLSLECFDLLKKSLSKLDKDSELEFTVEGNPDSFSREKLEFLKTMGVNRLSIGLQAWQEELLRKLGRVHNLEQFKKAFEYAREIGFNNINVDLMFGLPGQKLEDWKETLQEVIALNPEHISCYSLIVEEGTPFCRLESLGRLDLPDEETEREMYKSAVDTLKQNGYFQYEISNFAKPGCECKHNLTYWNLQNYAGCGSAAHSYVGGLRYRNTEEIEKYIYMIENKKSAVVEEHVNSIEDDMEEFMFMGLRKTEGINEKEFEERFNKNIRLVYGAVIDKFTDRKLLFQSGSRIYLSPKGVELSNQVMCEFIF
jgi:oxygen-independent coproporphyrinogen-3 oxidase